MQCQDTDHSHVPDSHISALIFLGKKRAMFWGIMVNMPVTSRSHLLFAMNGHRRIFMNHDHGYMAGKERVSGCGHPHAEPFLT